MKCVGSIDLAILEGTAKLEFFPELAKHELEMAPKAAQDDLESIPRTSSDSVARQLDQIQFVKNNNFRIDDSFLISAECQIRKSNFKSGFVFVE